MALRSTPTRQTAAPTIWTLNDGSAGAQAQADGLAHHIGLSEKFSGSRAITARTPGFAKLLPPALAAGLGLHTLYPAGATPPPNIVIGCGSATHAAILALGRNHRAFTVCIHRPLGSPYRYDAIVAPYHDYPDHPTIQAPDNVLLTTGAVCGIHPDSQSARREEARARFAKYPAPYIGVAIGGDNRAYAMSAATLAAQLQSIADAARGTLLIAPSRRTSTKLYAALRQKFGGSHYLWDDSREENPYRDILAAADGLAVTADSVNMISEACTTGRPLYLLPLAAKKGAAAARAQKKFAHFHERIVGRGNGRLYEGEWEFFTPTAPLNETPQVAAEVWKRYLASISL